MKSCLCVSVIRAGAILSPDEAFAPAQDGRQLRRRPGEREADVGQAAHVGSR